MSRRVFKTCPHCGEEKPANELHFYPDKSARDGLGSWCKTCVNERPKPLTEARIIRNRARHRAMQRLVELHKAEFEALYEDERAVALDENDRLRGDPETAARFDGQTPRLRKGRRRPGEDAEARVDEEWCAQCATFHAGDHIAWVRQRGVLRKAIT